MSPEKGPGDFERALAMGEVVEPPPFGFVVSISRRGLHRKLHFVGSCFRVPEVHYKDFNVHGEPMPSELDIDSRCVTCFLAGGPVEVEGLEGFCSSSSSSEGTGAHSGKRSKGAGQSKDRLVHTFEHLLRTVCAI